MKVNCIYIYAIGLSFTSLQCLAKDIRPVVVSVIPVLCPCLLTLLIFDRFKFDDERVTKEEPKRALEEQYGGEEEVRCTIYL